MLLFTNMDWSVMENDAEVVVVIQLRLPCGHLIDQPKNQAHVVCEWDNRKWHVYNKRTEWCAREE